jgi:tripartite-type tricarboxylate transporter receptor subunit TctC
MLRRLLAAALLLAATTAPALAQVDPRRPIRLIVGFGSGSVLEVGARAIAEALQQRLGSPIVVENRPGGGGVLANELVARAAPDGHTLVVGGLGSHAVLPAMRRRLPFDMERDFTAIARYGEFALVLMVPPNSPATTVQDFVALAKARPGQLNFGTSGVGTSPHLSVELLQLRAGIQMTHVPYRGTAGTSTALIAGEVQLTADALPAVMGLIQQGTIRGLAVTSAERDPGIPNVPTLRESGLPDVVVTSWIGMFGPAGMPRATVDQLSAAILDAARAPDSAARLAAIGARPVSQDAATFDAAWRREIALWRGVVRDARVPQED